MRTLKFRYWDQVKRQMHKVSRLNFDDLDNVYMTDVHMSSQCVIMQYTGIKDGCGLEIYEDDLIQGLSSYIYKVNFFNGSYYCGNNYLKDFVFMNVVGNIYENPELLSEA